MQSFTIDLFCGTMRPPNPTHFFPAPCQNPCYDLPISLRKIEIVKISLKEFFNHCLFTESSPALALGPGISEVKKNQVEYLKHFAIFLM